MAGRIAILGSGGWGMALAIAAHSKGLGVTLWSPFEEEIDRLKEHRANERLLPGVTLPEEINLTTDLSCASGAVLTVIATPSTAVRETARRLRGIANPGIVVNVSKGIEKGSLKRLSQVIAEELPDLPVAVLSGPSHAEEVSRGIPTSLVAASEGFAAAAAVQELLSSDSLRIYTSDDLVGVELGGALKNVIAICAGFCEGLGLGDNTKAALITRGLAEMARLGVCMGAREHTFAGLAGVGDLVVTCTSRHSRNNRFGRLVGEGTPVAEALRTVGTVEGYYAALMAHELAARHYLEMPITEQCYSILYEGKDVNSVVRDLMQRPHRTEHL